MNKLFKTNERFACLDIHSPLYLKTKESKYSGGDIGEMYKLVELAKEAGFKLIELTPIQDTGLNPCPYMGVSVFSLNPIHLDIDRLPKSEKVNQIIKSFHLQEMRRKSKLVNYRGLYKFKISLLKQIFRVQKIKNVEFDKFDYQVLAYAVFLALKNKFQSDWIYWPKYCKDAKIKKIIEKHPELHQEIKFHLFTQAVLKQQWGDLKDFAKEKGIHFIIDKPIYPVHNSAEVWANQKLFYLNSDGSPKYVSGCNNPRDPFGPQIWGHAVYQFKEKPKQIIDYFLRTFEYLSEISNIIRLDNSLSLIWKYYLVDPHTEKGIHRPPLKHKLFSQLEKNFPNLNYIAEDVGFVSPNLIDKLLVNYSIPGMRCLQWNNRRYKNLTNYPELSIALTSNHDTESLARWWQKLRKNRKEFFIDQLLTNKIPSEAPMALADLVFSSKSKITSITLRDLANDNRRYNVPGIIKPQNWRTSSEVPIEEINWQSIAELIKKTARN